MASTVYGSSMGDRYLASPANSHHPSKGVSFTNREESLKERQKYLTAKYGADQMRLIRKRLAVEDWLDAQLRQLYDVKSEAGTYETEIDLDCLLDIDEDIDRRKYIWGQVASAKKSPEVINKFIEEVLKKADTL